MDIITLMLAKAMTPQGQTDTYVAKANQAAAKAAQAKADAEAAIAAITAASEDIAATQEEANELLETAREAQINTLDIEDVEAEVKKFDLSYSQITSNSDEYYTNLHLHYPDGTGGTIPGIVALKKATGNSEIAGMTQKAITEALGAKADKTYVDQQIAAIPVSSGNGGGAATSMNLGPDNAGYIVVVGEDGNIKPGDTTETAIIDSLIRAGIYQARDAVGLDINYQEKSFTRTQDAAGLTLGEDFDDYIMYGGRVRCNVADDGTINAFYGEVGYKDDGSNGQVMVYQPKFYYQRTPLKIDNATEGQVIRRESIIISAQKQSGMKLHPLFDAGNGQEYDYVLLPAYEGVVVNDKLSSIAGEQPTSDMTITQAESYATARGTGWHIMNMAAQSANQMLEIVEFGTMNGQSAIGSGISNLSYTNNVNCSAITGSTASLGNATGYAETTVNINNGTEIINSGDGKRAISYRGMENPWGNMWQMIGGVNIKGDGNSQGGAPYICKDFNYTPTLFSDNYEYIGFNLPSVYGWISAMGYGSEKYDWVLLPIECASTANSLLPVGDNLWTISGLNELKAMAVGGTYGFRENNGPFYYACDRSPNDMATHNCNARLMFIPTKNAIYTANIEKWQTYIGG